MKIAKFVNTIITDIFCSTLLMFSKVLTTLAVVGLVCLMGWGILSLIGLTYSAIWREIPNAQYWEVGGTIVFVVAILGSVGFVIFIAGKFLYLCGREYIISTWKHS